LSSANWEDAKKAAAGLKNGDCMLTDGSSPGDWRLPTNTEWEETMKNAKAMGCSPGPTLTNDAGTACLSAGPSSFTGVESDYYWSSTALEGNARVYLGDLDHGNVLNAAVTSSLLVWPVRGGQR
jgi:formylglycine-generating enzyme required for sulfatase activity